MKYDFPKNTVDKSFYKFCFEQDAIIDKITRKLWIKKSSISPFRKLTYKEKQKMGILRPSKSVDQTPIKPESAFYKSGIKLKSGVRMKPRFNFKNHQELYWNSKNDLLVNISVI